MDFGNLGWKFPPTFNKYSKSVETVSDKDSIRESLYVLLTTTRGERLMVLDYGCDINTLAFKNLDLNLTTFIQNNIKTSIIKWEPRVDVSNVIVTQLEGGEGVIEIKIEYKIKRTNEKDNLIFTYSF